MPLEVRTPQAGRVETVEVDSREPGHGEVRLRIHSCGICGSDLRWFGGHGVPPMTCPGHECCGVIDATGPGVQGWASGDEVTVEPINRCGSCPQCLSGNYQLCNSLEIYGVHRPGAMASEMIVPAYSLYRLPAGVGLDLAALAEPLAVAVHATRLAGVGKGSRVLVLGGGTIGLLSAVAAREQGADLVGLTARYAHQQELASALGVDMALSPEAFSDLPETPDIVIETVGGSASTLSDATFAVARGGTVVVVGIFDETPAFNPMVFIIKETRIIGSMAYGAYQPHGNSPGGSDFETALSILARRTGDLKELLTHKFALQEVQGAFETAADKSSGAVKVVLAPDC